jgi:hypothetical protein
LQPNTPSPGKNEGLNMQQNGRLPLGQAIFKGRFLYLLVFVLMLIAVQPLDETIGIFGVAANRDLDDTFGGNCKKRHSGGVLP